MDANYFELFGLHPSFTLDQTRLTQIYHQIQSRLHPDRHVLAGTQEQRLNEQKSALINEAYRILRDDCERARHLLDLRGHTSDDQQQTAGDSEFLAEQMELREALETSQGTAERQALQQTIKARLDAVCADFATMYEQGDNDRARATQIKMQFFSRLHAQLAKRLHDDELDNKT